MSNIARSLSLPYELYQRIEERLQKKKTYFSKEITLMLQQFLDIEDRQIQCQRLKKKGKSDKELIEPSDKTFGEDVSYIDWERPRDELFWDRTKGAVGGKAIAFYSGGGYGVQRIDNQNPHLREAAREVGLKGNIFELPDFLEDHFQYDPITYELVRAEFPFLSIDPFDQFAIKHGLDVRVNNGIWESQVATLAPNSDGVNNGSPMLAPEKKKLDAES